MEKTIFHPLDISRIDFGREMYFYGKFEARKYTQNNNILIAAKNCSFICVQKGVIVKKNSKNKMVFLIPKRRVRVMEKTKYLLEGEEYIFKLTRETKSKKMVLSEIFKG